MYNIVLTYIFINDMMSLKANIYYVNICSIQTFFKIKYYFLEENIKMIQKKLLSLILCISLSISLAACSLSGASSEKDPTQPLKQTQAETTEQPTTAPVVDEIDELIGSMTIEEKVGQMFYVRCPDTEQLETIQNYNLGGYILFGRDFEDKTKDEVIRNIESYQQTAKIPMLIGADEEGGTVVRVSDNPNLYPSPFLSPSDTYANGGWEAIEEDAANKADLLLSLGINVNMAPDCDITSDPNAFMYYRSFSDNVDHECEFVQKVVSISKDKKLGTVLKHFPGYGNVSDTHTGIAYDDRDYSDFEEVDFKPFITGIESGADCILVAHTVVSSMDSDYPASLSEKVHEILRNELNFDGVIMTDDLSMDAIRDYTGDSDAAVFAVKSGNDILCCTDVATQYPAVLEAVKNGEISQEQIDKSVKRILKWKQNLGLELPTSMK